MSRKSSNRAERVVKYTRADGTPTEYRYNSYRGPQRPQADTLEYLLLSYGRSPEWRNLRPASQILYTHYHKILAGIGHLLVKDIDRRSILELRDAVASDRGDGAGNNFMIATGALFRWALKRGWIEYTPCTSIEPLKRTPYPAWTLEQIEQALGRLPEELCRAIILALYTGQRRGDLVAMTWAHYDGQHIKVCQQKTDVRLTLPCHPFLKQCLDAWKAEEVVTPTILHNSRDRAWRADGLSNAMLAALRCVPGFAGHNIHGMRKAAASMLAEAGCTSKQIAAVTGHQTLKEIERYTAAADQQVLASAAVVKFPILQNYKTTPKNGGFLRQHR